MKKLLSLAAFGGMISLLGGAACARGADASTGSTARVPDAIRGTGPAEGTDAAPATGAAGGTDGAPGTGAAEGTAPARVPDVAPAILRARNIQPHAIWLSSLDLRNMTAGYGQVRADKSVDEHPITLGGIVYPHGIGTHSPSEMTINVRGVATRFLAMVGLDDGVHLNGNLDFTVEVDGKQAADTGPMHGGDPPRLIDVDLHGAEMMTIAVKPSNWDNSNGHADWAGAMIQVDPAAQEWPVSVGMAGPYSPTRIPAVFEPGDAPAIHGPQVVGTTPHRPFLFLIPATGKGPLTYSAQGLPRGLTLDPHTGIISGAVAAPGTYDLHLGVTGAAGHISRAFRIVAGDHALAQTPPMGWNAWNVYGDTVTADDIRDQADWMVKSGLAAHGFQYLIIDDSWQGRRDQNGEIGPSLKFGDIKSLAEYVHHKGLKLGIESAATQNTCSGYAGSAGHELQDAKTLASWGVDYLKYDWCPDGGSRASQPVDEMKAAYGKMRSALDSVDRDIVYAVDTFGIGYVWDWGASVGANSWWTNPGIFDQWDLVQKDGFSQNELAHAAGPGHWNDPGWLMLGKMDPNSPHFSHLKPAEQMSELSLWCMAAAPLILTCDMTQLDPNKFYPLTTALLTNDEVLAIDQDPLGKPGTRVGWPNDQEIWSRPLADGTVAVGFFNRQNWQQQMTVTWQELGLTGPQPIRDLWQHRELGEFTDTFKATVPPNGVVLVKIGKPKSGDPLPSAPGSTIAER